MNVISHNFVFFAIALLREIASIQKKMYVFEDNMSHRKIKNISLVNNTTCTSLFFDKIDDTYKNKS